MHETILISDIDLADERYRISSDNDIISLAQSIKIMGLINIPMVKTSDHGYIVVSGFRRIKAMVHNGTDEIQARVLPQNRAGVSSALPKFLQHDKGSERAGELHQAKILPQDGQAELDLDLEAVLISISDNAFQREFDTMEQAKAVVLLSRFISFSEIAEKSYSIFNAKMNSRLVQKLFTTGSMPKEIHELIRNGKLSMTAALRLNEYDGETMQGFIEIFKKIKMGLNKQIEIITNIHETARRDDTTPLDLLNSKDIKSIIDDDNNDNSRKGNLLRTLIAQKRFPNLLMAKKRFSENMKQLKMGSDLKLVAPVNFEAREYTFSFNFTSLEELKQRVEKLDSITKNPIMEQIVS